MIFSAKINLLVVHRRSLFENITPKKPPWRKQNKSGESLAAEVHREAQRPREEVRQEEKQHRAQRPDQSAKDQRLVAGQERNVSDY